MTMLDDKRKLIIMLALVLTAGFTATAVISYVVSSNSIREKITTSELPLTSDNVYTEIQKDLIRPTVISSMMASDTFLRDWVISGEQDVSRVTRYLKEIQERYGAFTSFFVSEKSRLYYQTGGVLKRVREDEPRDAWYFRVRKLDKPYEINVDPDLANKDALTIFINYRVLDYGGNYIGAAGIGLTVDAVRKLINQYQQRYGCTIYFVDRQGGFVLVDNESSVKPGTSIRDVPGLREIAADILRDGGGKFSYRNGDTSNLLNVRFIPELDWHLFVERDENRALQHTRETLYINLAISFLITVIVLLATTLTIRRYQRRLENLATTDRLTGLANRQAFDLLAPQAMLEQSRSGAPLLAMMIDIDNFKAVNDRHGHLAGDGVLQQAAAIIRSNLRKSDIVCRWGGEEFLVVLKGTSEEQGRLLADKIRNAVELHGFRHGDQPIAVTLSIGITACRSGDTIDQMISRADRALYAAKAGGRNLVQSEN
jgi:diguanylate cyclase (GGDEF)-like protein